MKYFFFILLLSISMRCNSHSLHQSNVNQLNNQAVQIDTCTDQLVQLIVTSTNFKNPFQEQLSAEISKINDKNYTVELFILDSGENTRNTVGWIKLDIANKTLIDITNDPDDGILLLYDQTLYNNYLEKCLKINYDIKDVPNTQQIRICKLPFNFDDYYAKSFYPSDSTQNYYKYSFTENCAISKIIKGEFYPSEYMYLPPINQYQIIILCNTDSDIEFYNLIVVDENQIISSLFIGKMDGVNIMDFDISANYIITLYNRKTSEDKRVNGKSYKIGSAGEIKEM